MRLEGLSYLRFYYINALKESHCLRLGSANEILSNLSKKDENRMIDGLIKHNFDSFWEINQPLCDKHLSELKKFAIRVFCNRHYTYVQLNIEAHKQRDNQEEISHNLLIGEALEEAFPRLFEKQLNDDGEIEIIKKRDIDIVVQGVEVDMKTPLYWMQLNLSNLDNFLYVCFHLRS